MQIMDGISTSKYDMNCPPFLLLLKLISSHSALPLADTLDRLDIQMSFTRTEESNFLILQYLPPLANMFNVLDHAG